MMGAESSVDLLRQAARPSPGGAWVHGGDPLGALCG
jgi:hypothetical protein